MTAVAGVDYDPANLEAERANQRTISGGSGARLTNIEIGGVCRTLVLRLAAGRSRFRVQGQIVLGIVFVTLLGDSRLGDRNIGSQVFDRAWSRLLDRV